MVDTFASAKMIESNCTQCGQCVNRCPVGALNERFELDEVLKAVNDPSKIVVFQTAPSVRVSMAEEFGCEPGTRILTHEIVTGIKHLNPEKEITVFDTNFTADLTIMEEGTELLRRLLS